VNTNHENANIYFDFVNNKFVCFQIQREILRSNSTTTESSLFSFHFNWKEKKSRLFVCVESMKHRLKSMESKVNIMLIQLSFEIDLINQRSIQQLSLIFKSIVNMLSFEINVHMPIFLAKSIHYYHLQLISTKVM